MESIFVSGQSAERHSLRWLTRAAQVAFLGSVLGLAACSNDDNNDSLDMIEAFNVVGQADFDEGSPNRGGAAAANTLAQPLGNVATDGVRLFVADYANSRVLGYSAIPTEPGADADMVFGQDDLSGNASATTQSTMALPASVFVDANYMVVADFGNNRVLIWNGVPTVSGTLPDVVVGQSTFTTKTSGTTDSLLKGPTSAVIAGGKLLVADQNNNRVLVWEEVPTTNGESADLVLGQQDFTTSYDDDEADEMNRPAGLWSDGTRLLVTDAGNHRVLYWSLFPQASGDEADYVIGQSDFSRSTAGTSSSTLRTPYGISSDGTFIYIADSGNNRVLEFDSFPIANGTTASKVFGQEEDNFSTSTANDDDQDGDVDDDPSDRTVAGASGALIYSGVLYVTDRNNNRVLMFPQ